MSAKSRTKSGQFQKGGPQGPGRGPAKGAPNAGRPPSELREAIREACDRYHLTDILLGIVTADIGEQFTPQSGDTIYSETKNSDRIAAAKLLMAYGYGQPTQTVDTTVTERRVIVENGPDLTK